MHGNKSNYFFLEDLEYVLSKEAKAASFISL